MINRALVIALSLAISALAAPGDACLTPVAPIEAEVVPLGPTAGGLEELQVHVRGFELAGPAPVGCTIALSLEPLVFPAAPWAIQLRVITHRLRIVDPSDGSVHSGFFMNQGATDFNGETLGYGYFSWPMPVWFQPFSTTTNDALNGTLPQGEVTLVFDLLVKPGYTVQEVADDLAANGWVGGDYSFTDFPSGTTYLFWSSFPLITRIDAVIQ